MSVDIRFATLDDFEKVRLFDPHSKYIDPEKIITKIRAQEVILALADEMPVGIIKFSYFWATRPYMDLIWVDEDLRKRGIGVQLLSFLEMYLVNQGYDYLYTSAEEQEKTSQQWHRKQGFVTCGVLSALNLPHDKTREVFFYKHLTESNLEKEHLKTYQVLPEKSNRQ